jgi:cobyrinic acid a,c-diamide synthase
MGGEAHCRQLLYQAAGEADLILVEGVMGLFDGDCSSADLASLLGIPVMAVIDGSHMAQTFGALALGLASYRPGLPFAGAFANRLAGERHYQMLADALPPGLPCLGWLPRDADIALPARHLGLVQAAEIADLEARLDQAAAALRLTDLALPAAVTFRPAPTPEPWRSSQAKAHPPPPQPLTGVRIAVARDAAFAFLYRANLELLSVLGAELAFFSPLADPELPPADALYLPGGYPELHLERLAANQALLAAVRAHHAADKPLLAECGGMLYLLESLTDQQGRTANLAGLLPGRGLMGDRLANLGMHEIDLPEGTLRGHGFHYSRLETPLEPIAWSRARRGRQGEPAYRLGSLLASYLHLYFPSNPAALVRVFAPDRPLPALDRTRLLVTRGEPPRGPA